MLPCRGVSRDRMNEEASPVPGPVADLSAEPKLPDASGLRGDDPVVPSDDTAEALRGVVAEVEAHVGAAGWDAPARLFALVPTQELAMAEPELAAELGILDGSASMLTPVEQELDEQAEAVEALLARIAWPAAVHGAVVVVERVVLPPAAEVDVPEDPAAAADYAAKHPERADVRIAVGALRSGVSHCVVRMRAHDSDDALLQGADVVPALVSAVRETLEIDAGAPDGVPTTPRGDG